MIVPDFREYKGRGNELLHSAKGTTWGKHKYVSKKVVGGVTRYIYPSVVRNARKTASSALNSAPSKAYFGYKISMDNLIKIENTKTAMKEKEKEYEIAKNKLSKAKEKNLSPKELAVLVGKVDTLKKEYEALKDELLKTQLKQNKLEVKSKLENFGKKKPVSSNTGSAIRKGFSKGYNGFLKY